MHVWTYTYIHAHLAYLLVHLASDLTGYSMWQNVFAPISDPRYLRIHRHIDIDIDTHKDANTDTN